MRNDFVKKLLLFIILATILISACNTSVIEEGKSSEITEFDIIITPELNLSLEETIQAYFESQYSTYVTMNYLDLRFFLEMDRLNNINYTRWLRNILTRRKAIEKNKIAYVDKEVKPFNIIFNQEVEDDRMSFFEERDIISDNDEIIHFTITSEKDTGYPPFFAMNDQHTMALNKDSGRWKIVYHYFPGASRHRSRDIIELISQEEMEELVKLEVAFDEQTSNEVTYDKGIVYDNEKAVEYAYKYISNHNDRFYLIDALMGNCANFTSQVIWYGFAKNENLNIREYMTDEWYAGYGGGSPAWENVEHFWRFATKEKTRSQQGMYGEIVNNINLLEKGGLIQIRSKVSSEDGDFNHNLILVDKERMLLAQNSPDCFIYYSDIVNVDFRFFNPKVLIAD